MPIAGSTLPSMQQTDILPHLFRQEFSNITAVLAAKIGMDQLERAEDIASETFLAAMETWPYRGVPAHPKAWLYRVAKNKVLNYLRRKQIFNRKVAPAIARMEDKCEEPEFDLSEQQIQDSLLRMMVALSQEDLPAESQVVLALRYLCGFGIDEIATALLANKEAIVKRLQRAKAKLKASQFLPSPTFAMSKPAPIQQVLTTLYLLFNEGYYSETHPSVLREELCSEAMRLVRILTDHPAFRTPPVLALQALMYFHASRFPARRHDHGMLLLYENQNPDRWDQRLIYEGVCCLREASQGDSASQFHIEATIAYWHTIPGDNPQKWRCILQLYDYLQQFQPSPVAALNRLYALAKVEGAAAAIASATDPYLPRNRFYFALMGELFSASDQDQAVEYFRKAWARSNSEAERELLQAKINAMGGSTTSGSRNRQSDLL